MGRAQQPSIVTLPESEEPYPSLLDFLCRRFPAIARAAWEDRLAAGKVLDEAGRPVGAGTPYRPRARLFYFRESRTEPKVPGEERIVFQDAHLLVADKPHFLPVVPAGRWVDECLLERLRRTTGCDTLAPLHRIDRETAGLVLFSCDPGSRGVYGELFRRRAVEKTYLALSAHVPPPGQQSWHVEDRLERGEPWFRMQQVPGPANARSIIELVEAEAGLARFRLCPLTGKKHQLRVHMASLGFGILHDRLYPTLAPERDDDYAAPLQLLAQRLAFRDPLTGERRELTSERGLERP